MPQDRPKTPSSSAATSWSARTATSSRTSMTPASAAASPPRTRRRRRSPAKGKPARAGPRRRRLRLARHHDLHRPRQPETRVRQGPEEAWEAVPQAQEEPAQEEAPKAPPRQVEPEGKPMKAKKIAIVPILAAILLSLPAAEASAASPAPGWELAFSSQPTQFESAEPASGAFPGYLLSATNLGGAPSAGAVTLTATLPAGITPISATLREPNPSSGSS